MSTLGEVKERVRSLCEDEDSDFMTDAYLTPKINQAYGQAIGYLLNAGGNPFSEEVRDLPLVAAGTTNFIAATAPGGPWEGLENPIKLEVKQVGQPVESYAEVPFVETLPNVSPITAVQPGILFAQRVGAAEWRGSQIYVTPFAFDVDARLRADFRPAKLLKDSDRILVHAEMDVHLSYSSAAIVGAARGHSGWVTSYGAEAEATLDIIASKLTKQTQGYKIKFARTPRRRRIW